VGLVGEPEETVDAISPATLQRGPMLDERI